MVKQFLTISIRNLLKDKILSFINLSNLIVGFATFILISLFIYNELNWDKHNINYNRIYRLQLFLDQPDNVTQHTWSTTAALGRHELLNLPEIEKIALIHDVGDNNKDGVFLSLDKKNQLKIRWGYYADPTVFDVFTFNFLEGTSSKALKEPFSIVLSQSVANRLFPNGNAIGKQVYGENKIVFTVTGIYEDLPLNSNWRPHYLLPMNSFAAITGFNNFETNYFSYSFNTYVLLKKNTNPALVDIKIENALQNYRKEHHPYLRPLSQLHLNPYFQKDIYIVLSLFSFTAILILTLASVNYINIQTAKSTMRLKEIGIKKTVGFSKRLLWCQFMFESVFISLISGLIGIVVAQMMLPIFNKLVGSNGTLGVPISSSVYSNLPIVALLISVSIITGILSGLYPAYIISRFNPIKALKQNFAHEPKGGFGLKKILVTLQFGISLFLLITSFIVYKQTQYMLNGEMGFNSKSVVFANIVTAKRGSFEPLRQRLTEHPEIKEACFSDYIPFIIPGGDDISWEGGIPEDKVFIRRYNITYDFFKTFNIPLIKGRNFSRDFKNDGEKCIINETAARVFQWNEPLGKHIINGKKKVEVIGVIKDYIAQSMHNPIEPHWYHLISDSASLNGIYSVQFEPGKTKRAMEIIKSEFEASFPEDAFEFSHIENLIRNENAGNAWKVIRNISVFFSILSIIISSVGLFGLVMFFAKRKMKEIGIRKVLGFSSGDLYVKLSSEFLWLLLIANILAWPAAFLVYKNLPGAHKYPIQVWEFILASAIVLSVALLTISYHILKSVKTNPVEILKYE